MPARKHNMFVIKLLSVIVGIVSTGIAAFTINWQGVIQFGTSVNFLYENVEHLEHMLDDGHEVLGMKEAIKKLDHQVDSIGLVLANRDSLIHIIELFNRGKMPYDSIWRLSESGDWYKTTVEYHYKFEHND